ncbi:M20/M25/M40 family metallo-hydrolase [Clostridium sp. BJN0001]|uniref:M20/M25/M40 family metallo-hydrolase n=1 Tax=Clostridium sp. BJN0001 TaxID=2930219 RepID=UPI001FD0A53B|nr:M20/M25/M40 family metallo-hydrolase [Clostridium sp. BJN0001]
MFDEILNLTKKLVSIKSVNGTSGEKDIGCFIEQYLRNIPYFKEHKDRVIVSGLKNDKLGRRNVIAVLIGEKEKSDKGILLHGHTDTVDVKDYHNLEKYAFSSDELMKKLHEIELPLEVKEDLESNDYLFGRGACDMKGGDAVFLVLLKNLSEKVKDLKGNIVVSFNPVEENLHTGMIESREVLEEISDKYKFKYIFAINNDYICPLYKNDTTRYVYTGSVGKILPCFYIMGKETHVGQCFEGVDASLIASEIVKKIDLNPEFSEKYNGEYTLPPSVLKIKDLKKEYNVQTSFDSFLYFNYFIHNKSIIEIMNTLKKATKESIAEVKSTINDRYKKYCMLSNTDYSEINFDSKVLSYEELLKMAEEKYDGNLEEYIDKETEKLLEENLDKREISLEIVKKLCSISQIKKVTVVIFFAAPYCPHNTLKSEEEKEEKLYKELSKVIDEFSKETNEKYKMCQFFPSLSDSSYLKIDDDYESIESLINNFPEYKKIYNLPLKEIKKFNVPGINFGCFGKDAHKWTERVYMPYSFNILPRLILKTLDYFLN